MRTLRDFLAFCAVNAEKTAGAFQNGKKTYVLDLLVYVSLVVKFLPANLLAIYIYIYT